jgi:hypothetical protein
MICNLCGLKTQDVNDFGNIKFYFKKSDEIIHLRYLCDDCGQKMSVSLIMWSNHISQELLRKIAENQSCFCGICEYTGIHKEWSKGSNLVCPNCGHIEKIMAIG